MISFNNYSSCTQSSCLSIQLNILSEILVLLLTKGKNSLNKEELIFFPLNSMQTIIFATGIQQFLTTAEPQLIDLWKTINFK